MAVNQRFPKGIKEEAPMVNLISDNRSQPANLRHKKKCARLDINQIFTTWSNPKANADTKGVIRRIKKNLIWPNHWKNPFDFADALTKWIENYNTYQPHQALNYIRPGQFNKSFNKEMGIS